MSVKYYCKLVRDKIPKIIEKSGKKANIRYFSGDEYQKELKDKIVEEANELLQAETKEQMIEEMADIIEVVSAIGIAFDIRTYDVVIAGRKKNYEKGAFDLGCYLESVED